MRIQGFGSNVCAKVEIILTIKKFFAYFFKKKSVLLPNPIQNNDIAGSAATPSDYEKKYIGRHSAPYGAVNHNYLARP